MPKCFRSSDLAHEIAFAIFRVAALTRHERLRKELEGAAVELVREITPESVSKLERLVRLAEAVEGMSQVNAMVLCRELGNLRIILTEIAESISGVPESIDLRAIFSGKTTEEKRSNKEKVRNRAERQEAILGYIRKFPNGCRMRQLSTEFASFSERTVRTDVQRLMEKDLIEKIGSKTGPFSYFRMVDSAHSTDAAHSTDSHSSLSLRAHPSESKTGQADSSQASPQPSQSATAGTAGQAESPLPAGRQV